MGNGKSESSLSQIGRSHRLESIDALRGIAALGVVACHAISYNHYKQIQSWWFEPLSRILFMGELGVVLFFVVSGYCIHLKWTQGGEVRFLPFWKRRMFRLYPPYFVALVLSMSLMAVALLKGVTTPLVSTYSGDHPWRIFWADFFSHVFILHGFIPSFDLAGGNAVYWSLAREEHLYLLYFLVLFFRKKNSMATIVRNIFVFNLVFGIAGYLLLGGSKWWSILNSSVLALWSLWLFGAYSAEGAFRKDFPIELKSFSGFLISLAFAVATYWVHFLRPIHLLAWGWAFFLLINIVVDLEQRGLWPKAKWVQILSWTGTFSYSIYLVHCPIRSTLKVLLGSRVSTENPVAYLLIALGLGMAGVVGGYVFFQLVERHFLNSARAKQAVEKTPKLVSAA